MSRKKDNDFLGKAVSRALNDAFQFGAAHQRAMDAGSAAGQAQDVATQSANALMPLILTPSKKDMH